ncbi:DUF1932 domain-containing protein, partial [Acidobacteria bacterium ACD]|nr:DUF1932 domain-containing protein [Acidobacteria bacterium ACD]
ATRIALSGAKARDAAGTLCSAGLNTVFLSEKIGTASTFKMLRSIFSKGVEALLIELLVTARRAGLAGEVWEDICDFMSADSFQNIAENWVRTHAVHCERRRTELEQVVETVQDLKAEPVMTRTVEAIFARSVRLGLESAFADQPAEASAGSTAPPGRSGDTGTTRTTLRPSRTTSSAPCTRGGPARSGSGRTSA